MEQSGLILLEKTLLFASLIVCALSAIAHVYGWVFTRDGLMRAGRGLLGLFFLLVTAAIAVRWVHQGHGPYITLYEVLLSNTWVAALLFLLFSRRFERLRVAGVFLVPILLLTLGGVAMSSAEASMLTPSYKSIWLIIHVSFAKLTYGSVMVAVALSVGILLQRYVDSEQRPFIRRLPDPHWADELSYKLIATALFFCSIMIVAGAIWANQLWGKYWGWDPVEVWALVTWLVYALFLHLRVSYDFKGIRAAVFIIASFVVLIFSFFILPFVMGSVHNSFMFAQ